MTLTRLRRRVLKRIPKASQIPAADKLAETLRQVITDPGCIDKWVDLMTFAYSCFAIPGQRGGQRHLSSLASKVNRAIASFPASSTPDPALQQKQKLTKIKTVCPLRAIWRQECLVNWKRGIFVEQFVWHLVTKL